MHLFKICTLFLEKSGMVCEWRGQMETTAKLSPKCRQVGSLHTRFLRPWGSPGKNTGVGSHSLLQGIFPTQGLNSSLLHYRQILYCLSHQGSPITLLLISNNILPSPPYITALIQILRGTFLINQSIINQKKEVKKANIWPRNYPTCFSIIYEE